MKKIGIICALHSEIKCLTGVSVAPMQVHPLNDHLFTILSGMGEQNVRQACELLLDKQIELLLCFGTCAALTDNMRAGDLILAKSVVSEDGERLPSPESCRGPIQKYLHTNAVAVHLGDNFCSTSVITSASEKTALAQKTGAISVDMESAFVFRIAADNNIPALSLRVVVDESQVSIPSAILDSTDDYGQASITSLLLAVIRQPGLIADLIRLGRAFSRARVKMLWLGEHAERMFTSL